MMRSQTNGVFPELQNQIVGQAGVVQPEITRGIRTGITAGIGVVEVIIRGICTVSLWG